ncbi:4-alpha-glucanotransferase (plasmid) [Paroceanicella profunda]|uniref:4-alpha-glucanotransferase n=1 Tax=Paroceanicella profunda TaxID=2579971 RepID=A0A5B8FJ34_9RHOB|nr:4-alpha-glucanotransferase [Paroceanicella profunda]QDL94461.1 4-alpha-glucanotransferase [Paroceanicella profunda]
MNALTELATAAGLSPLWRDAQGRDQEVSPPALAAILGALGLPAQDDAACRDSLARLAEEAARPAPLAIGTAGTPLVLDRPGLSGRAELVLESGTRHPLTFDGGPAPALPPLEETGYHRLSLPDGTQMEIAICPARCPSPRDLGAPARCWGVAVQVPALQDDAAPDYGDFGALARFASALAGRGADLLAISPVHALFPAEPARFSPYAPSTRLFLNTALADPGLAGAREADVPGPGGRDDGLIDWEAAIPARRAALRRLFEARRSALADPLEEYVRARGEDLVLHATFDALHARFPGTSGWPDWPEEYHDPRGPEVLHFRGRAETDIAFHIFEQWLAERGLAEAQAAALAGGMHVGLVADLAVGMDAGGSHAWSRPGELLTGLSVGAPPDPLGPDGQDWGLTTFDPRALRRTGFRAWRETLRASLRQCGGLRIDHILGLRRLWVIPHGAPSTEGAYLAFPQQDMLRLLALEASRAGAIVVGEDLGTVPEGLREDLAEAGLMGMRVLWFERDAAGAYTPPEGWEADALAMSGTHDTPTVAGWWSGRDIDWTWRLGRGGPAATEPAHRALRARERSRLWQAFCASGAAEGAEPAPEQTVPVVEAALAHVASAACAVALLPAEDLFGLTEQPNLPGTTDAHPNWRRRLPPDTPARLEDPAVEARIARISATRHADTAAVSPAAPPRPASSDPQGPGSP